MTAKPHTSAPAPSSPRAPELGGKALCLVDAHVHIHGHFDRATFLNAARKNFQDWSRALKPDHQACGILLLTEMAGVDAFSDLANNPPPLWQISPTRELVSLTLIHDTGAEITIVSGRQIATSEGLEVLALGTRETFTDRQSIEATLEAVGQSGAMAVLPWSVGKWLGYRGTIIDRLVRDTSLFPNLEFGDNGNRPIIWPTPKLLSLAQAHGRHVLPGSDPLPLAGDVGRAGQYGFIAPTELGKDHPFQDLRDWLKSIPNSPRTYGKRDSLHQAIIRQCMLRLKKP